MAELESLFDEDIDKARKMDLSEFYEELKNQATPVDKDQDPLPHSKN
jgi:glutathione-regulated potassium-efflux system protein KefB